jgi:hypothetical protein
MNYDAVLELRWLVGFPLLGSLRSSGTTRSLPKKTKSGCAPNRLVRSGAERLEAARPIRRRPPAGTVIFLGARACNPTRAGIVPAHHASVVEVHVRAAAVRPSVVAEVAG